MKRAAWMVVKDDEFYADLAIRSVMNGTMGIYILDTGSTDGTKAKIDNLTKQDFFPENFKMVYEVGDFGCNNEKFASTYREADARNYAMKKALDYFNPDFLIQVDADEVYNEHYWEIFEVFDGRLLFDLVFGHSTNMLVTPFLVSNSLHALVQWDGVTLYDPHVRAWSAKLDVEWVKEPGRHVIPKIKGHSEDLHYTCFTTHNVHFHLHRSFGPKSLCAWLTNHRKGWRAAIEELGIDSKDAFKQETYMERFSQYFKNGKFVPPKEHLEYMKKISIPISHKLPDYVIQRWQEWGEWE